jgi:peptide/nickel transport system substrate-binding protein
MSDLHERLSASRVAIRRPHILRGAARLKLAGFGLAVGLALGAGAPAVWAQTPYKQSPLFDADVQARKLPPVAQRLPKSPRVITPSEQVGRYGGTWRMALRGRADSNPFRTVGYDHLVSWKADWSGVVPNVLEGIDRNADGTEYTLKLREGMRWSDGVPFTADDLMFAYQHVFKHKDLGGFPEFMRTGSGPGTMTKLDATTVKVTFPVPNAFFMEGMAQVTNLWAADPMTKYPAHFLKQFHPDFNQSNLDQLVAENGARTWADLFLRKADTWLTARKPTLNAWIVTTPFGQGTRMIAERNPYYFKVDTAGNQLPYIDRMTFENIQDDQVHLLKILGGEIDFELGGIASVENKAVFADNATRGNYRFIDLKPAVSNITAYSFNLNSRNPVLRQIFNNKTFRIAMSHAIDRQAINEQIYVGQLDVMQPAIRPDYPVLYNERLAKQYTTYDVALANRLLDEAGFAKKDSRGIRLGPDGKPISFGLMTRSDKKFMVDTSELLSLYFKEVGIDARLDVLERSLTRQRSDSNEFDVIVEDIEGGRWDVFLRPYQLVPTGRNSGYGLQWLAWWMKRGGEEPPPQVKRQYALFDQINATTDEAKRIELMRELIEIAADVFPMVGIGAPKTAYAIANRRLRNVPDQMEGSYWFVAPGPYEPSSFFFGDARR